MRPAPPEPSGHPPGATDLYGSPNALAPYYSHFRVAERALLTGHSHQAWPDVGLDAQRRAWLHAADRVDEKWEEAFAMAERVRTGYRRVLDDAEGLVALGSNTHELLVRFLSALPLRERPRLLTTDGEFHTIRRQLDRLAEAGLEVEKVPARRPAEIADELARRVDDRTSAVLVSSVLYQSALRVPGLDRVAVACERVGAELLVDAYHQLNVVPMSLAEEGLEGAFVVGGGYKYCQLGEGNCFLRFPRDCRMRPVITGWFSEFSSLSTASAGQVLYGEGPDRFAGSTYDPVSHYRAAAVFEFFESLALAPPLLRTVSQHQISTLVQAVDGLDLDPVRIDRDRAVALEDLGGFLALKAPEAGRISAKLRERGVFTDFRGSTLRLGPAPYLSDRQLLDAVGQLGEVVREITP